MSATTLLGRKKVDELGFISGNANFEIFRAFLRSFLHFGILNLFGELDVVRGLISRKLIFPEIRINRPNSV